MINIAITDDHPLIIKGIKGILESHNDLALIAEFSDGNSTIGDIKKFPVDLLMLDYNLPDMDGEEICKSVLSKNPQLKILVLTSFDETGILKKMMNAGALGFVLKNAGEEILLDAIKSVNENKQYIQKELQDKLVAESISLTKEVGYLPKLTRREKEILKLILDEMTTAEIAEKLFLSPKTVETHRLNMLSKLNVKNTAGLVKLAISHSLV